MITDLPAGTPIEISGKVRILYTNWKGKTSIRLIAPLQFYYGVCEIHGKEPAFYLRAYCCEKKAERTFKMADIHWWEDVSVSEMFGEESNE